MMIYVGIPMYGGAHGLFVRSLLSLQSHLTEKGHTVIFDIVTDGSVLPKVRNGIVKRFIDSNANVLLFLDSDMCFEPQAIEKLINAPFDVSVANYRAKNNTVKYVAERINGYPAIDGFQQTHRAGTGIMAIKRQTIDGMIAKFPDLVYVDNEVLTPCLFDFKLEEGQYYGEDYTFCERAESAGMEIYILSDCFTGHIGTTVYGGNYKEYLRG
jgi:hypothetical protein